MLASAGTSRELWGWLIPELVCFEARSQVSVQTRPCVFGFRASLGWGAGSILSSKLRHPLFWRRPFSEEGDSYGKLALTLMAAGDGCPGLSEWLGVASTGSDTIRPCLLRALQIYSHLSRYLFHPGTVSLGFRLVTIPGQFTRGD